MRNIFRKGTITNNFKVGTQTEHEYPYHRQSPWPPQAVMLTSPALSRPRPRPRSRPSTQRQGLITSRLSIYSPRSHCQIQGQGLWLKAKAWQQQGHVQGHKYWPSGQGQGLTSLPLLLKVKATRLRGPSDSCWQICRERKVP